MHELKKFLNRFKSKPDRADKAVWDRTIWLRHRPWRELPAEAAFVSRGMPPLDDVAIDRLLTAYRCSHSPKHYGSESMWRGFFEQRQADLHETFMKGTIEDARRVLSNPGQNNLFYGFDNLFAESLQIFKRSPVKVYGQMCMDDLLCCAEAWGVLHCDNPESLGPKNDSLSADEVLNRMEEALGIRIKFPNPYPDEVGLVTSRGIASDRVNDAIDLALKIKKVLKDVRSPRVMEIGGGLGRVAYYAIQFGLPGYEIVDLPFTAISQGYFLMTTLGPDKVALTGEKFEWRDGMVKLSSPSEFLNSPDRYDLILNSDSLTEIDREVARQYWDKIESCAKHFLSVNHEANQFTVRDFYTTSKRVKNFSRNPNWLRRGYVEELIEFS